MMVMSQPVSSGSVATGLMLMPYEDRPVTRGDCAPCASCQAYVDGLSNALTCDHEWPAMFAHSRPCPYVSCRHHMAIEINEITGKMKLNFPTIDTWEMPETCSLDVADRGPNTLEDVGRLMSKTRERIRQLEVRALMTLRMKGNPGDPNRD